MICAYTDISHLSFQYIIVLIGREMNIQVATSELPITSVRGPRLSGVNYTQRPQSRFRGSRGTGSIRGNSLMQLNIYILIINVN